MKKKILSVGLGLGVLSLSVVGLVACGDKQAGEPVDGTQDQQVAPSPSPGVSPEPSASPSHNANLNDAIGLYEAHESLKNKANGKVDFFIITPDSALYTLINDGNDFHIRDYEGSLAKGVVYTLSDTAFSSGDIVGHKFHDTTLTNISNDIKILTRVNEQASRLKRLLEAEGITVGVQLAQDKIQFAEEQEKFIEEFVINSGYRAELIEFLKSRKLTGIRINDYVNNQLYMKEGFLCVPKGISGSTNYLADYGFELDGIFKDTLYLPKI